MSMDARILRFGLIATVLTSAGAVHKTPNFTVHATDAETARQVGETAEHYRRELAIEWLGHPLPNWSRPCPIKVQVGQIGAGGATSFKFDRGEVYGWEMNIQGTLERILDSVVPHEVSHTIFASHFRRPLPRWADEGAATLVEHESERRRQTLLLDQVLKSNHQFPLRTLLSMKEYPSDMRRVLTLYAQGYSLADFLIEQGGKARYLQFLEDAHQEGWDEAISRHYAHQNVELLEKRWNSWVLAGSPRLSIPEGSLLADGDSSARGPATIRGQSPDEIPLNAARAQADQSPPGRRTLSALQAPDPRASSRGNSSLASTAVRGLRQAERDGWAFARGSAESDAANGAQSAAQDSGRRPRPAPAAWDGFPTSRRDRNGLEFTGMSP